MFLSSLPLLLLFKRWNSGEFGFIIYFDVTIEENHYHVHALALLGCSWEATSFLIPSRNCVTVLGLEYEIHYADSFPGNMKL